MEKKTVYLMLVLTAIFWSGAFITGKLAVEEFPPVMLTFFRFLISLPFIFGILIWKQPSRWRPTRKQWGPIILLGIIGIFLYHTLFFYSLNYTTAINASLIGATTPMFTAILAVVWMGNIIRLRQVFGILCSLLGVFLVITNGNWQVIRTLDLNSGDILMLLAVMSWSLYSVISVKVMKQYTITPMMLTAYTFLVCTLITAPMVIWEGSAVHIAQITWGGWLSVVYMAIFSSVIGYLFQTIAIQQIGAYKASVFNNLVPVFTIVLSIFTLGEDFSLLKLASSGVIILGIYLTIQSEKSTEYLLGKGLIQSANKTA